MGIWMVLLGWILFAGTHIGMSAEPFRGGLVAKAGEKGFQGIYSLVALISFGILIAGFVLSDEKAVPVLDIGSTAPWMISLTNILMLLAFVFLFCGFTNPSPMGMAPTKPEAYGIIRVTRHPMNVAFALFGLAHLLTNRQPADWIFYSGFVIYGILGSMHQDKKKIQQKGEEFKRFVESTSVLPFVAIITGKQQLKLGEISKIGLMLAIVGSVIGRLLHASIRSQIF